MLMGWLVLSISGFPGPQCQHDGPFFKQLTFTPQPPCSPQLLTAIPHCSCPFSNPNGKVKKEQFKRKTAASRV